MKNNFLVFTLVVFSFFYPQPEIEAQSYYHSNEFGVRSYLSDAQAIGMGGTFLAVADGFRINLINPAGLVFTPVTRMTGDFVHQAVWSESKQGNGFDKYTNLNGVALAIPLKSEKLVTAFSLNPTSQFDFEYFTEETIDDYQYKKLIQAKGGLNKITFGVGFSPLKHVALGVGLNYYFGKLEHNWKVDYVSDLFWDVSDKLTRKMWGSNISAGFIISPLNQLFLGGFYSMKHKINSQDQIENSTTKGSSSYTIHTYDYDKTDLTIPEFWGMGFSYIFKPKFRLSSDLVFSPWSKFKIEDNIVENYQNSSRIGIGFEILPSMNTLEKYYKKMSYRLGYYFQNLNFLDENGQQINENGFTLGFGFPYYGTLGRIDVALNYCLRGNLPSNPVKENILQIFISVNGGEKWFRRGEQR